MNVQFARFLTAPLAGAALLGAHAAFATIRVDAVLDETEWESAQVFTDFRVTQPYTLAAPRHPTEVRMIGTPEGIAVDPLGRLLAWDGDLYRVTAGRVVEVLGLEDGDRVDNGALLTVLPTAPDDVDSVIHLTGLSNDPTADFAPGLNADINVRATRRLAETVAQRAADLGRSTRFLFASTCSVYYTTSQASEVDALHANANADPAEVAMRTDRLTLQTRIFEERVQSLTFVCEVPTLIEQRLYALAKTVADILAEK